ncbi:MAG: ankyrin repeat domain-containing protein [Candidatus Sulfotelmatobacter sp.]
MPAPMVDSFYAAVVGNKLESVKALVKDNPDLVLTPYLLGETPLHLAAKWGHKEILAFLLASQADVNAETESGDTPLHYAAENGEKEVAALLLASNAEIDARNKWGQTALHWAAQNGHKDTVALLLDNGAQVNARDNHGQTPVRISARWEPEVAELLRRYGGRDAPLPN